MRTLVGIKDIQQEFASPLHCTICGPDSEPVTIITAHLEISPKGSVLIQKGGECPTHGYFVITKGIKAAVMHGRDAQIIPKY